MICKLKKIEECLFVFVVEILIMRFENLEENLFVCFWAFLEK